MAKSNVQPIQQKPRITTEPNTFDTLTPVETFDDTHLPETFSGENIYEGEVNPMKQIVLEMEQVANGKSVADLRKLVSKLAPKNKDECLTFMNTTLRLRQAAEAVHQAASEAHASLFQ